MTLFDIVIPIGPNDINVISKMIEHTQKYIIGYRNIYLVSFDPTITFNNCITIDENIFPFNKKIIANYLGNNDRIGWYLQQLIKLYSGFVIKDILNNYLVIDSDTYFYKSTTFFNGNLPLYNIGTQYHRPYFEHLNKLHPTLTKQTHFSGICHHMMFQINIIIELFKLVEEYHNDIFYIIFLKCINKNNILGSGASEYEIYFNYLHIYHKNKFLIRQLKWKNTDIVINDDDYDYISCHWYLRNLKKNKLPDIMDFLCHRFKFNLFDGYSFYTLTPFNISNADFLGIKNN